MDTDYKIMYEDLLQFLYRTPLGFVQANRNGDIQMLNPVAAQILMQMTVNGRIDNLFALLRRARPELENLANEFTNRSGVVCEDLPVVGYSEQKVDSGQSQQTLKVSIFVQNQDSLMVVLRESRLVTRYEQPFARSKELDAMLSHDQIAVLKAGQHSVTWANVAAHSLFRYEDDALSGLALSQVFCGEDGAELLEDSLPVLALGGRFCGVALLRRKDGSQMTVSATATAISGSIVESLWILLEVQMKAD